MSENAGVPGYQIAAKYLRNRAVAENAFNNAASSDDRAVLQQQWDQWVSRNLVPSSSDFAGFYTRFLQGKDLGL